MRSVHSPVIAKPLTFTCPLYYNFREAKKKANLKDVNNNKHFASISKRKLQE